MDQHHDVRSLAIEDGLKPAKGIMLGALVSALVWLVLLSA